MTWIRHRYTLSLSPRGTARVTFADGCRVILCNQRQPAKALLRAWRVYREEQRHA